MFNAHVSQFIVVQLQLREGRIRIDDGGKILTVTAGEIAVIQPEREGEKEHFSPQRCSVLPGWSIPCESKAGGLLLCNPWDTSVSMCVACWAMHAPSQDVLSLQGCCAGGAGQQFPQAMELLCAAQKPAHDSSQPP